MHRLKAGDYFGLKQYDAAIESSRRSSTISRDKDPWAYFNLIPALALTGREAEARETLQRYLALVPGWPKTIAAWRATIAPYNSGHTSPRELEAVDRNFDGLRKAGMPEQ
jgi:tetratricopeptide (TPR) repeat protein